MTSRLGLPAVMMDPRAYREFAPAGDLLRAHVECFWHRSPTMSGRSARILPDGCIDVIWADDRPPVVAGPMTVAVTPALAVGAEIVGVRFRPGVAPYLLGVSARELRDRHVALRDMWPADRHWPWAKAALPDGLPAKLAAIEVAIATRLASVASVDPLVTQVTPWLAHNPAAGTGVLTDLCGLSERQLRRRFDEAIGYGPKKLQRILRLQRLLWLASQDGTRCGLSRLAFAAGYADQPHMTREVVALAGLTPRQLLQGSAPRSAVADLFKTLPR